MPDRKFHLHNGGRGAALTIRITPRAAHNEITAVAADGTLKVRLTAPDADANPTLLRFLAEVLDVPASGLEVVAGESGRDKIVSVLNLDPETVHRRILAKLA
jgi:uncharacterized protein YggU (UPF0235/DUF167 family)